MGHQRNSEQHASVLDPQTASTVAAILQGLATPSRLRIIATLQAGPMTVSDITAAIGMEQSAVSHQLRHLRDLRFVVTERQGRSVIYRLFDNHVVELITQGLAHAEHLQLDDTEASPNQFVPPSP
ncbi:MAG: metalloregulator ArsR/SmtB family transcription factor [Nocardioides sp.]